MERGVEKRACGPVLTAAESGTGAEGGSEQKLDAP